MTQITASSKKGRKAATLEPPSFHEDAAERKRVLNVLAQRRYRQRRRNHVASLESQVRNSSSNAPTDPVSNLEIGRELDEDLRGSSHSSESSTTDIGLSTYFPDPILFPDTQTTDFFTFPSTIPSETELSFSSLMDSPSPPDLSSQLQMQQSSMYTFPDDKNIEVPELNLLRACLAIAQRLNVFHLIMDLTSLSPFTSPRDTAVQSLILTLPANLRPTRIQSVLPHHPLLDCLPWPTVRNKLISIFSLSSELRPPQAKNQTALQDFVYDMEDSLDGVRVWGEDPYCDANWEVGQKVFQNWWWALDGPIVARSNQLRRQRGAPPLTPMGRSLALGGLGG